MSITEIMEAGGLQRDSKKRKKGKKATQS